MPQNKLCYGDNLEVMRKYLADESIDLCYIDPPFNSNADYNRVYLAADNESAQSHAFTDTWSWDDAANAGLNDLLMQETAHYNSQTVELVRCLANVLGKGPMLAYLIYMAVRVQEIWRVLKPTGSFYLHCDPTASHYLKILLDTIFVKRSGVFCNEIIWHYQTYQGQVKRYFPRKHDVILFYNKSENGIFHLLKDNVPENAIDYKRWKRYLNENNEITGANYPKTDSRFNGYYNRFVKENGREPNENDVIHKIEGHTVDTVWDIKAVDPKSKERLGYSTQKPLELLERIIQASSNEGDVILDCFCGCGTTVAAAQKLNRKWIGIDITYNAIAVIKKRMLETYGEKVFEEVAEIGIPNDWQSAKALAEKKDARTRKEFEKWAVLTYTDNRAIPNDKKGGDEGIDGTAYIGDLDDNSMPIAKKVIFQVKSGKNLSPSVIRDLDSVVSNKDAVVGILITLYPVDNLVKKAKEYGTYKNKLQSSQYDRIQVVSVEDMLKGARFEMPTATEVLKKAKRKDVNKQMDVGF